VLWKIVPKKAQRGVKKVFSISYNLYFKVIEAI